MMISRYFHIINDKKHWNHNEIKDLSFEDGFIQTLKSISPEGSIPEKMSPLQFSTGKFRRSSSLVGKSSTPLNSGIALIDPSRPNVLPW